jgi:hypothetical protein
MIPEPRSVRPRSYAEAVGLPKTPMKPKSPNDGTVAQDIASSHDKYHNMNMLLGAVSSCRAYGALRIWNFTNIQSQDQPRSDCHRTSQGRTVTGQGQVTLGWSQANTSRAGRHKTLTRPPSPRTTVHYMILNSCCALPHGRRRV